MKLHIANLHQYQNQTVNHMVNWKDSMLWLGLGLGKAQPLSEPLLTPNGWSTFGDIKVGDLVIGSKGSPIEVIGYYPQGEREIVEVTFNDGSTTKCDWDHLWTVKTDKQRTRNKPPITVSARWLHDEGVNSWNGKGNVLKYSVPLVEAIQHTTKVLPIEPYLFGVFLGDGWVTEHGSIQFCTDSEILNACDIRIVRMHENSAYTAYGATSAFKNECIAFNLIKKRSWEKVIPEIYLLGDIHQRLAILQGLMDTDGSPNTCGGGTEFSSTSENLIDGVVALSQSLGGIGRKSKPRRTTFQGGLGRVSWRVNVKLPSHLEPFRLKRKLEKWIRPTKYHVIRKIVSIKPVGIEQAACIRVNADDHLYVTKNYIVTHNTIASLTAFSFLLSTRQSYAALVVAPLRVCQLVWRQEAQKWSHVDHLTFSNMTGTAKTRERALFRKADIYLINYESLSWLVMMLEHHFINQGRPLPFDMLIWDEVSKVKRSMSKRFEAFAPIIPHFKRRVGLTASPCSNGLQDLWGQFFMVDGGERLGTNYPTFQSAFFHRVGNPKYQKWEAYGDTRDMVVNRINDITIEMKASDHLDMPELTTIDIIVKLPPKKMKMYKELEKNFFIELDNGVEFEVFNKAALSNKLLQYSNGIMYHYPDPEDQDICEELFIHDEKYKALNDIVTGSGDDPILLAYQFQSERRELQKRYPDAECLTGVKEAKAIDIMQRFNAGEIKLLIAHPQCLEGDTEVLTEHRGWVKIIDVDRDERVFDGVEFTSHNGCSYSGYTDIVNTFDIGMTTKHELLINNEWIKAKNVRTCESARKKACYTYEGNDSYLSKMCPVQKYNGDTFAKCEKTQSRGQDTLFTLHKRKISHDDRYTFLEHLATHARTLQRFPRQKLWWTWNICLQRMGRFQMLLQRYVPFLQRQFNHRANKRKQRLQQEKLRVDHNFCATREQKDNQENYISGKRDTPCGIMSTIGINENIIVNKIKPRFIWGSGSRKREEFKLFNQEQEIQNIAGKPEYSKPCRKYKGVSSDSVKTFKSQHNRISNRKAHVYDLVDCGKRHRFLIRNNQGEMFVSHNSAGHGLNLQEACNIVVWFGLNYNLELYEQFIGRIDRQGQPNPVRCLRIVTEDTMDYVVMDALEHKNENQSAMRDAIGRYRGI